MARRPPPVRRPAPDTTRRAGRLRLIALAVLVAAAAVAAAAVAGTRGGGSAVTSAPAPSSLPGVLTGPAPWSANTAALRARLQELGLPALSIEGTALHIHAHLDVYVEGRRVTVPAGIGIAPDGTFISPLHTHDDSGVIHVESPDVRAFTLGEFLGVWGLRLTPRCVGGYCARNGSRVWVFLDGRPVSGDTAALGLGPHDEIVIAYGTRSQLPRPVPSTYDFAPGL